MNLSKMVTKLNRKQKQIVAILLGVFLLFTAAAHLITIRYQIYRNTVQDQTIACMPEKYMLVDKSIRTGFQRGDTIAFIGPVVPGLFDQPNTMYKRIIAMGGDHIEVKGDNLYINNELIDHRPLKEKLLKLKLDNYYQDFTITLGPDQHFMMGDNRERSFDSRYWGPITYDQVVGKMIKAFL